MMIQLNPPVPVETPLGSGWALVLIDYGPNFNTVWTVALINTGQIKHFDSNDIKLDKNYTFNISTGVKV
jgi:hypothetical protein